MSPDARRRWLVLGLTVAAVVAIGLAWWLMPRAPDVRTLLTPEPGTIDAPPLPPPRPEDTDLVEEDTDTDDGSANTEDTAASPGSFVLDPDLLDTDATLRTEDGVPLFEPAPLAPLRAAIAPSEARITHLAADADGTVLAGIDTTDGGYVQLLLPDLPERRVVRLEGVDEASQQRAHAREPVFALTDGTVRPYLLGDGPAGPTVWTLDRETMEASPITPAPPPVRSLQSLSGLFTLAVVADQQRVLVLDGETWRSEVPGPAGLDSVSLVGDSTFVFERSGSIGLKRSSRTVPETIGQGREPVSLSPRALAMWVGPGGAVQLGGPGVATQRLGTARRLPGPDLVRGGREARVCWVRPDGRVGCVRLLDRLQVEAFEVPLDDITALATGPSHLVVAGRDGPIARVERLPWP